MIFLQHGRCRYRNRGRITSVYLEKLAHACGYRVSAMADHLGISSKQLETDYHRALGILPKDWLRRQRMIMANRLMRGGHSLKSIGFELGFSTYDAFRREFKAVHGVPPSVYLKALGKRLQLVPVPSPPFRPGAVYNKVRPEDSPKPPARLPQMPMPSTS